MSELAKNVNDAIQTMAQFNFGGDDMELDIGGNQSVRTLVEERAKQSLLKNYSDMLLHVPGALDWVLANPVKKPWIVHRNIAFIEAHAVNCDNAMYEEMEFRGEFEPKFTEEVEKSREFLESCDTDSFEKWCDETIGDDGTWTDDGCDSLDASMWCDDA